MVRSLLKSWTARTTVQGSRSARIAAPGIWTAGLVAATFALGGSSALAQSTPIPGQDPVYYRVDAPQQKLEMIVNSSRILTVEFNIPKYLINNRDVATITPLAANQIQVSATRPGVTQINLWNEAGEVSTVDVVVFADARELQNILATVFPEAQLKVLPTAGTTQGSVIVSGYVADRESIPRILDVARDFYPNVINNVDVGGTQQVALKVKVLEVSRTKLRQAGVDWALILGNDYIVQNASNLISAATVQSGTIAGAGAGTITFGVTDGQTQFLGALQLLQQNNLAKLLAEPTLTTVSGRAASFNSGGEVPIPTSAGLGSTTIEYRPFGTGLDFVPIVLGNGKIRLEVRPTVREIDETLRDPVTGTPGFRTRQVDTAVELMPGQTLALAGLLQTRVSATRQGIPWLSDLPWVGAAFRTVRETNNEVELLVLVTPELVAPLDPHEVPPCGPGQFTTSPDDVDLYFRGYLEVPRTDDFSRRLPPSNCPPTGYAPGYGHESYEYQPGYGAPVVGPGMASSPGMASPGMTPPQVEPAMNAPRNGPTPAERGQAADPRRVPPTSRSAGMIGPTGYAPIR